MKGQNIAVVKKKPFKDLAPLELEALLADQLINRLKRQIDKLEQNPVSGGVPSAIVRSTEEINLNPD